jgi:hypothetical protein
MRNSNLDAFFERSLKNGVLNEVLHGAVDGQMPKPLNRPKILLHYNHTVKQRK